VGKATNDTYREPAASARVERKDRGSRFIAEVFVVRSPEAADARIDEIRRREYDATHHCSAWRVGPDASVYRSSDDGEPSGSAGAPILAQIEGRDLTNTLVVVTRYYGGSKLGVGGLVRAYGGAASDALDHAGLRTVVMRTRCVVRFEYDDTSAALHTVDRFDIRIVDRLYAEDTGLVLDVRNRDRDEFAAAFTDALGGRGSIMPGDAGSADDSD